MPRYTFAPIHPEQLTKQKGNQGSPLRRKDWVPKRHRFYRVRPQGCGLWRVETRMSSLALPCKIDAFSGSRRPPSQSQGASLVGFG